MFCKSYMSMGHNFKWVKGYVACRAHLPSSLISQHLDPLHEAGAATRFLCSLQKHSPGIYCVCVCMCVCVAFQTQHGMLYVLFQTLHVSGAILKYHPLRRQSFDPVCFQTICKVPLHRGILMSSELEMVLANSDPSASIFPDGCLPS